jgi:exopolysaccharide biosynthesis protein
MTYFEAAHFMIALGCSNAMMLDGGRSSEMVARLASHGGVKVINRPSSGGETPLANGLFIYQNE